VLELRILPPICPFVAVASNPFPGYALCVIEILQLFKVHEDAKETNMLNEAVATTERDIYEATLHCFDTYIISQVHRLGYYYARNVHPAVLDLELDEVVQRVRIKFWQALEKRNICYPYAYIKLIIQSEFIDMTRRQKRHMALSLDEELDALEDEIDILSDPVEVVVQQVDASTSLKRMIRAVLALPPRQQYAMICSLEERVDDLRQLTEAFKLHKMDIQSIQWPVGKAENQLLHASLIPAKKTLAKRLLAKSRV
jgi:DNA-directed RNA polymerase specialized sigma24 family protein